LLPLLRKCCEPLNTNPVLLSLLMHGLNAWLCRLVNIQSTLGWRQLFNGRWPLDWATAQDRFLSRHFDPVPDSFSGHKWTTTMIVVLWTTFCTLWDLRNGHVHRIDTTTWVRAQKEKAHRKLVALYALREHTRHCDRDLYFDTDDKHLHSQPVWALKNWLLIHSPLVIHSIKEAARQAIRNV
jgi:hypothetical protein